VSQQGIPHQVLVWYVLQDDEILVATPPASYKVQNIRANPWTSISISDGPRYLTVRGQAIIDDDRERGTALYRQVAIRYLGVEGAEQWLAQSRAGSERVTVRLPITHITAP
jgi:hypothetical protein